MKLRIIKQALAVLAGIGVAALCLLPSPALAAIFGVPTNLNADGSTSGTTADPPGWMWLYGTGSPATSGDTVFQMRLFIEVTGTTLDIRVFDPGNSGTRDRAGGTAVTTDFKLLDPCTPFPTCAGNVRAQILAYGNDANTVDAAVSTDNHLVRFGMPTVTETSVTTVTVSATNHGFANGTTVTIAGASQAVYNGSFVITLVNANTFTYTVNGNAVSPATGSITASRSVNCGTTLTDQGADGRCTVANHGFTVGANVVIAGVTSANAASYNGARTIVATNFNTGRFEFVENPTTGSNGTCAVQCTATVTDSVTSLTASATVTATTTANHGFSNGDSVTISGANETGYNGTFTIAGVAGTTFTYTVAAALATPATGTIGVSNNSGHPMPTGWYTLNSANAGNVSFSGLSPGLYEFRMTMSAGTNGNLFGVDIRDAKGSTNHYNVYTIGRTPSQDSALLIGTNNNSGTAPQATITNRMFTYPYVTSGCSIVTSNFDEDAGAGIAGDLTDASSPGNVTGLTMSGNGTHSEDVITVSSVTDANQTFSSGNNLVSRNYGMYLLTNSMVSPGANMADWRVADFTGWSDNPAGAPRNPNNAVRTYLPNGYSGAVPPSTNATPPVEPIMAVSAFYVSGQDPPAANQTSRFTITASVSNPAESLPAQPSKALSDVQITVGLPNDATVDVAFISGTLAGFIDGASASCTDGTSVDGSGHGYVRCTFSGTDVLAAGSIASINFDVNYKPLSAGLRDMTGPPASGSPPPNTSVWSQFTSKFATTETLGPVCNLVVDTSLTSPLVTRASLAGLRVSPPGVVEFATGSQRGTVAFNIYGTTQADGRGTRVRLNSSPINAPVRNSLTPVLYRVETASITTPYLMIEEIDAQNRSHFMGPVAVGDQRMKDAFAQIEAQLAGVDTTNRRTARVVTPHGTHQLAAKQSRTKSVVAKSGSSSVSFSSRAIKIATSRAGLVQISLASLPFGVVSHSRNLSLTNQGQAVAFTLSGGVLSFVATELSTDYTGKNVYVLSWNGQDPPAPAVLLTRSEDPKPPATTRAQENTIYFAAAPQGSDPWLWDLLFAGDPPGLYTFDVPGLVPGSTADVAVRIRLLGGSSHQQTVQASINGVNVGSVTFTGTALALLSGHMNAAGLMASGNQLTLTYSASGGLPGEQGQVYFDYVDLDAPVNRSSVAGVVDGMSPYDPTLPSFEKADYLIVTHALFRGQAEQIATLKRRAGFRSVVVDVERAYDHYSSGIFEANAVRKLISDAAAQSSIEFVLLVGDDTFDPRDYSMTGQVSFIPSLNGWDGEFGLVSSENKYADVNGDGIPDLAIGRLTVQTPDDAAVLVDKITRQASVVRTNKGRFLFAMDNQGPSDISFLGEAQVLINTLPGGAQVTLANVADGITSARNTLLNGLRQGELITSYFGHGGPTIWADEHLLTLGDMAGLANTYHETVLFTWGCEAQFFQYLFGPSINEALLLVPGGGALASFGPAGITDPSLQRPMLMKVYQKFLSGGLSLGEAIRQAKAESLAADPATKVVIEGWNLLGDPSLQLPVAPAPRRPGS